MNMLKYQKVSSRYITGKLTLLSKFKSADFVSGGTVD